MFAYIAYDWSNAWWFSMWCQIQDEFAFNVSVQRPFQLMPGISLVILILENHLIFTIPVLSNFMFLNVCLLYELGSLWWIFLLFESQKFKDHHLRMSLHFQSKCEKANLQTLLGRIKLFKVNSKKKNNLKLSRISWEIHLWYLLFELLSLLFSSQHSTSPCPASSASSPPRPPPSSSPSSFPAIFSGESTVWARIWD